jgi:hypothetical protein
LVHKPDNSATPAEAVSAVEAPIVVIDRIETKFPEFTQLFCTSL